MDIGCGSPYQNKMQIIGQLLQSLHNGQRIFTLLNGAHRQDIAFGQPITPHHLLALILTDTAGIQRTTPLVNNGNFIRRNSIIMYDVTLGTLTHGNDVVCMLASIAAFVVINLAVDQRKTM